MYSEHLAHDFKLRKRTYVEGRVQGTINPIYVCRRQSARDDEWIFLDTAYAPRLHGVCCLEDPVCRQEYDCVSE